MKNQWLSFFLYCGLIVCLRHPLAAQTQNNAANAEVTALVNAYADALLKADVAALERLARFRQDWERMDTQFHKLNDEKLALDLRLERAYQLWHTRQFDKLRAHLIEITSPDYLAGRDPVLEAILTDEK